MSAHAGQPSQRARELSAHLREAIAAFRVRDAKVSDHDVEMALALLRKSTSGELRTAIAVIASIVGAFVVVGVSIAASRGRIAGGDSAPIIWISIALAITGTVIGVTLKGRSD